MMDEPKNLLSHIIALREVLIRAIFSIIIAMVFCYSFIDEIFNFISAPLVNSLKSNGYEADMIYTSITEFFSVQLKLSFYTALLLCFPYIIWQLWKFVKPALFETEKKMALKIILISPVLFFTGVIFAFYVIIPAVISTLINDSQNTAVFLPKISENVSFILIVLLSFGISFQLPLIIFSLDRLKILKIETVRKLWREVIIAIVIISAIITPPDAFSMFFLAVPLIFIYFCSIFICKRKK